MNIPGITHIHSTYSYDGEVSLATIRDFCIRSGIRFVCMSEHTDVLSLEQANRFIRECEELSNEQCLLIPGFEFPYLGTHILAIGAKSYSYRENDPEGSLQRFTEHGALIVMAHPHRNGFRIDEALRHSCVGIEVWNSQYDGKRFPRWNALRWFRMLAHSLPNLRAFAGLDLHRFSHAGGPRLIVEADTFTALSILCALRQGSYWIETRSSAVDSRGKLMRPDALRAYTGSIRDILLIKFARRISRVAKSSGFARMRLFKHMREYLRKFL